MEIQIDPHTLVVQRNEAEGYNGVAWMKRSGIQGAARTVPRITSGLQQLQTCAQRTLPRLCAVTVYVFYGTWENTDADPL